MSRLLKTAVTVAGAGYALWRLLRSASGGPAPVLEPAPTEAPRSAARPGPAAKRSPASPQSPAPAAGPTKGAAGSPSKAELYERAKQLGIEGRSKMSKAELQRAIRDAD